MQGAYAEDGEREQWDHQVLQGAQGQAHQRGDVAPRLEDAHPDPQEFLADPVFPTKGLNYNIVPPHFIASRTCTCTTYYYVVTVALKKERCLFTFFCDYDVFHAIWRKN